ncbi:MAG: TIGR03013 family PEP-CTERM/XrtA system glycosyltransferase [Pseudomonadales bacterium]|nr:TIGR03013 family PEP-CTERM/XrtA system glycosyltransferase [Pseudomonadales bacterium]
MAHVRIFKHYVHLPYLLLGITEGMIFMLAIYIGAYLRFYSDLTELDLLGALFPRAIFFSAVILVSMTAMGVYQARLREGISGVMLRTAASFFLGSTALSMIFYLFPSLFIGRGVIALAALLSFFMVGALRWLFYMKVDEEVLKRHVLVLGAGWRAQNILDRLTSKSDTRGFILSGFVKVDGEDIQIDAERVLSIPENGLFEFCDEKGIDEIVVAVDDRRVHFPLDELLDCKLSGIDVVEVITFFERETGKVELDLLHPSWMVFSDGFSQNSMTDGLKRAFDIAASSLLFFVAWPVMLLTVIAIKLEDGLSASVFYKQSRVGLEGHCFNVYKFRSMREDAEKDGAQWAKENDTRITRVGHVIRMVRIDELPQILNVLKGDMGFVGPRPERPEFVGRLAETIPYFDERHRVKPGITGWAQLCYPYGASDEDSAQKLQYDLYYVKNHSLMLDVLILIQTVEVILFGKGAR